MPVSISVIVPTYNSSLWIEETLRSVLSQSYDLANVELIVVDDASSDDTVRIVRSMLEGHEIRGRVVGCGQGGQVVQEKGTAEE